MALIGNGVRVTWDAPSAGETPANYVVLENGTPVATVDGAAPVLEATALPALGGSYDYVVIAEDIIGNQNASAIANISLLVGAVTDLVALVGEGQAPLLSWQSTDPNIVGYNVYRSGVLLTPAPIVLAEFQDLLYAGGSTVLYEVAAVDVADQESPRRPLTVQPVTLDVITNPDAGGLAQPLVAGYLNQVEVAYTLGAGANAPVRVCRSRSRGDGRR